MRRLLLGLGSLALAGMGLFPPWQLTYAGQERTVGPIPAGYHFVLRSRTQGQGPLAAYSVDVNQLAIQMSVIVFAFVGIALIVPGGRGRGGQERVEVNREVLG
jgi:hypothetical protein